MVEGQTLKLFGRRGKTFKGHVNLSAVTALRPTTDPTAPPGALEITLVETHTLRAASRQTCVLAPDHSAEDLFMGLGNAVPAHTTSPDLWRIHMGSRPVDLAVPATEYRVGKTLGTGTFGKVKLAKRADGVLFAIKCLSRSRVAQAAQGGRLAKEIKLLKMLNHPNVIRLHEARPPPQI